MEDPSALENPIPALFTASAQASGIPEPILYLSIFLIIALYTIIVFTGLSVWISKCYNRSILVSILGSLLLVFWAGLYWMYAGSSLNDLANDQTAGEEQGEQLLEDLKQKFVIFLYLLVLLAGVLSYGFYRQVTGKCGLFV